MKWFVMLINHNGEPVLLADADREAYAPDTPFLFDSEADAIAPARRTGLGAAYGYETYEWPHDPASKGNNA